ncbi:hypothetical protein GN244_ATG10286 [Phytophthora infestans]|uniref:Uncharacterized protein n=1 Tax=Phytophthora infestans TaxID=4787 RepID=A0A833WCU5_PHYIN|nr:hypothetical protein GN244_ATG10286 [Phytophthora infestans]KAF4139756.1 hypothetical protein GN958_ATG10997 [Phytophthora infestans]KAF4139826.1 hypothetical protein GN958_ATG11067 [Phytophthora infestans]
MSTLIIDVVLPKANSLTFVNPEDWTCLKIASCPYWKAAESISWTNLPAGKFVSFYETTTCHAGGERYYLFKRGTGEQEFRPPQAIRSIMVGHTNNYYRRPSVIRNACLDDKEYATVDEANDTAANYSATIDWSSDGSTAAGGLSLNRFDVFPNTTTNE